MFLSRTTEYARLYHRNWRHSKGIKPKHPNGLGHKENRQWVNCFVCKKKLFKNATRKYRNKNNFCSRKCYSIYRHSLPPNLQNSWRGGLMGNLFYRRDYAKKYRELRGKQYVQLCNNKRRALLKDLTINTINSVYKNNIKKYGVLTCYLCLITIKAGEDHLEHKTPITRGGTNKKSNLAVSCKKCNLRKNRKTEIEFREVLKNGQQIR